MNQLKMPRNSNRSQNLKSPRILGIVLNLIAVLMVLLALSRPEVIDEFNVYWIATSFALVPGIMLLLGKVKTATYFARIVVGSVFIVSGLIKANDTVGFGIKLEEYFDVNALGAFWANFHDLAWPISMLVSGVEVLLGLALIYGAQARLVGYTLLGMTVFFGWLTMFTASCNDAQMAAITAGEVFDKVCVTDCGCFGDAMRGSVGRSLTPWESFYKDLGLFFLVLVIVVRSAHIKINQGKDDMIILPFSLLIMLGFGGWLFGWMLPTWFFIICTLVYLLLRRFKLRPAMYDLTLALTLALITYAFALFTYLHLPVKDFRPYAVGKNIKDQMKSAQELGLKPTVYANVYKMSNAATGETMTINSKEYLEKQIWKDENWKIEFTSPNPILIERGYDAPIASFNIMDDNDFDIGEDLINDENYSFMLVMYNVDKSQKGKVLDKIREVSGEAQKAGYNFYGLTSSPYEKREDLRHENQLAFPFYVGDEILLKTIIRANPGLALLKNGTIIKKWHGNDIPSFEKIKSKYLK